MTNRKRPRSQSPLFKIEHVIFLLQVLTVLIEDSLCWISSQSLPFSQTQRYNVHKHIISPHHFSWLTQRSTKVRIYSTLEELQQTTEEQRLKGHAHTEESKAKISAANKGKTPWNKGRKHSPETLEKIRQKTKEAMRKKKEKKALDLGYISLEEYEEVLKTQKKEKKEKSRKPSEETRKKISAKLKARWADPEYREKAKGRSLKNLNNQVGFSNRTHSEETRRKIAERTRQNWQNPEYRARMAAKASNVSAETREKISKALKARWQNEEFRTTKLANQTTKSEVHKKRIAEAIAAKWADPEYRAKMQAATEKRREERQKDPNYKPPARRARRARTATASVAYEEISTPEKAKAKPKARPKRRPQKIAEGKRLRLTNDDFQSMAEEPEPRKRTKRKSGGGFVDETAEERAMRLKTQASDLWDAIYADGEMGPLPAEDDNKIFVDDDEDVDALLEENVPAFEDIF